MDYDELSLDELQEIIKQASNAIEKKRQRQLQDLRTEIYQLVAENGFSVDEVLQSKRSAGDGETPKYRDPKNKNNIWSGRGRRPKWLTSLIESGVDLKTLRTE